MAKRGNSWVLIVISALLILTPVGLYFVHDGWQQWVNQAWEVLTSGDRGRINSWISQYGAWGPVLIVVLMTVQMFLFVIPSWLLMVISVMAYGPWGGGALALVAVLVAATVGYGIGKLAGEHAMTRVLGEDADRKVRKETERYGVWAVVITRINPLLSNDAISIIGGALGLGFWKFMLATAGGITPLIVLIGFLGADADNMKGGLAWLSAISLLGLGLKVWWDKRQEKQANASDHGERVSSTAADARQS